MIPVLCLGLGCFTPSLRAQGFNATNLREPTELGTGWLVHAGDDPAYAGPGFDDSGWTPFNAAKQDLRDIFPRNHPQVVWYRLHLKVAPDQTDLGLGVRGFSSAFEIYSNGVQLLRYGRVVPYVPYFDQGARLLVPIPADQIATGNVVIALRVRIAATDWDLPLAGYQSLGLLTLGPVRALREHAWFQIISGHAFEWVDDFVNILMLLGGLLLYSTQRDRREYLWLALFILVPQPWALLAVYGEFRPLPLSWVYATVSGALWAYFETRMYCAFVGHKLGWRLNFFVAVACLANLCQILGNASNRLGLVGNSISAWPLAILQLFVLPAILLRHSGRGHRETAFLIVPLVLSGIDSFFSQVFLLLTQVPAFSAKAYELLRLTQDTTLGPFYIDAAYAFDFFSMLALALIILIRSNRISLRQGLLEGEIANARAVQEMILPEAFESTPGFRVESVYEPARQVGGDFFQILQVGDGRLLLVLGDVAGKGLPAAMLVSMLVGAIRSVAEFRTKPNEMLAHLNQRLVGHTSGGFATALVAVFSTDGTVAIANAGHLSPYLNGKEIELPGALPLGILEGAEYDVSHLRLDPGCRLTFYSDGVVEAQDKKGNLFGFDRARELSTQPASAIAAAAKSFGQQDDITVVVFERIAAEQRVSVPQAGPRLATA